ncbi:MULTISPECIES: flagellar hook-associated protein FlgL [Sporomusa]|jgi:flagellar hook-associated protein 3 FlgL|uniref:Flagellar hook-associated protein 3 n=1 Tax=Sporomusa sphaeroides DSM 2875 TaxID=1337886 RepID=A0ABM9VZB4_9FIRM|nr:flagellar hook-associated protein FlgL [Sporomusa sphaeroides]OLS57052.1 flagellar hook-associated protein 3 [Sporomusa sphaeroides DSM 2875]CVK18238.1 Flagellar hook-associated protein 3 [Sporomusa sphaeroides DSM 2875]HML31887.1 flagellar hook-associated protein FlgL [Sporomusa sphaeroides]
MRVTNNMMVANTVWNINKNMERLNKASQVSSTQSKIQLPSDDPIIATRAIKYRSYVANVEQYQKNVESAVSWQEVTNSALDGLTDVVQRLQELVTQASSDVLNDSNLADIKSEVLQLQQTAIDYLNTSYAGRYVFAGYDTDEPPYSLETVTIGSTEVSMVNFKGNTLTATVDASVDDADITDYYTNNAAYTDTGSDQKIFYNVGFGTSLAVNVEGQDVTGSGAGNLFDTISKILIGLDGGDSYKTAATDPATGAVTIATTGFAMDDFLTDLSGNLNTILTAQTDLGARMKYAEMAQSRLASNLETYTALMSNNEDADIALASTDLTTAQSVYNASLSVGSIVMSKSLVDFLR